MERDRLYPLSDYQLGIFMDHQADSSSTAYNIPNLFTLPVDCDLNRLSEAVKLVFKAHPALLTRITKHNGELVQCVKRGDEVAVGRVNVSDDDFESYIDGFLQPFVIFDQPLYRVEIIETPSNNYFLFDFFHLISDGGSIVKFMSELDVAYSGGSLQAETITVLTHALEQTERRGNEQWRIAEAYFDRMLSGVEAIDFAGDRPVGQKRSLKQRIDVLIPKSETGDIRSLGFTPNQLFHAATSIVLSRICRSEKVTHATLHHGRTDEARKHNIGYYVRTLPVVIDVKKDKTVRELITHVQDTQKSLYQNVDYPFTEINRKYGLTPNVYYTYQGLVNEEYRLGGEKLTMRYLPIDQHGISVMVFDKSDHYDVRIVYDNDLYSEAFAIALGESVRNCALDMLCDLDKQVSQIKMVVDPTELLALSKGEEVSYDRTKTFVDLFLEQVKIRPHATAVVDELSTISYEQLDRESDLLASKLSNAGVGKDMFVGVMMPRVKEYTVAVIAVWKAGAAYVPLDGEYPVDRLQYMMEDSKAKVLITTRSMNAQLQAETIIYMEELDITPVEPINKSQPGHLAYMIYTSGSTGNPKGVMIPHSALTAFIHSMNHLYRLTENDKICCHSSFSFDASIEDLYPVLSVGGEMHILCPALRFDMRALNDYISKRGITGGCYTTQLGVEFITQFNPSVRYLTVGGEKMDRAPQCDAVIYNTYGPTEFTVDSTYFIVENGKSYHNIPIGRPLPNARAYIMDGYGNLMPREFAGELCMAGTQAARGYWCREELTAEKFLIDPFQPDAVLYYRTGDLARWNDDGMIEYLGRIDNQIKLRGFRIELGEIESRLSNYTGILSSCVEVRKLGSVEHLCAYYTSSEPIDVERLKESLSASLTDYMVPTRYVPLERMPLTPNGKVNRKALPQPILERETTYVAPETATECDLCAIFEAELKLPKVGIHDNFFEIGGSSLLAISVLIKIENKGYKLAYGDLFKFKTPHKIAQFVDSDHTDSDKTADFLIDGYDYAAINNLLASQRTDWYKDFASKPLGRVLLTGATGYLGAHLLYDLINNSDATVYCLLRSKENVSVDMWLKSMMMYYFGDTFESHTGTRIFIVEGDITDTDLKEKITAPINTVINSAALVKHYEAGNDMERINYQAVENLADYCIAIGARLIHVSTYSTAGVSVNGSVKSSRLFTERDLYIGQSHVLKYTWTKFLAERAILERIVTKGLRAKIMRVGNLMGRASDGEFQVNFNANAFVNSLRAYKMLGAFPLSRMVEKSEVSPIDMVAAAIVKLSVAPDDVIVLQPYNCYEHDMGAIIWAMQRSGYEIEVVSDEEFAARFETMMANPDKSHLLSGILHSSSSETIRYIGADNDITTTILYRLGFHWPQPDRNYMEQLLVMLDGMGFFDE